jgi:DNA processing protein
MHTVDEAIRRERPVLAVPGPVTSPTSVGTNQLLGDVAAPACGLDDVLVAVGLSPGATRSPAERRAEPTGAPATVLDAIGWTPATYDEIAARSGLGLGEIAAAVAALTAAGWVAEEGRWIERVIRCG